MAPLLQARNLVKHLGGRKPFLRRRQPLVRAVDGLDLELNEGEILGIVGESGCGKSTLGRTLLGIWPETSGEILLDGKTVSGVPPREARRSRAAIQYVHQDPGAALDPWWSIGGTLHEGLKLAGVGSAERDGIIDEMMAAVGLDPSIKKRYAHELSGGQLRRVGLARILILRPRIVILDEPTSGLDLSVQATVLRLFRDMRERFALSYIFISHDLSVVRLMCDRVAIMYLGKIVEIGTASELFARPRHPYTQALLRAAPRLDPDASVGVAAVRGDPPSAAAIPSGCRFRPRCPYAEPQCAEAIPPLEPAGDAQRVACIRWREIAAGSDVADTHKEPPERLSATPNPPHEYSTRRVDRADVANVAGSLQG